MTQLAAGASLLVSGAANALIDDQVVPFLGGGDKFDVNNANIRVYLQLPGMYPSIAAKITSNGSYKSSADVVAQAGLNAAEQAIYKKYEKQFVFLEPRPEYRLDIVNNGLYR